MKNKSVLFLFLAVFIFILVCVFGYIYYMQLGQKSTTQLPSNNVSPARSQSIQKQVDELTKALEAANQNSTTTPKEIEQLQNALEKANANTTTRPTNASQSNVQVELEKQATLDKERRDLTKALEAANR
jgi:flagellar basal body-associated protein FliL